MNKSLLQVVLVAATGKEEEAGLLSDDIDLDKNAINGDADVINEDNTPGQATSPV